MTWDIDGKTALITGGNSGIGNATAIGLAEAGANVVITARSEAKGAVAVDEIEARTGADAELMLLDLADLSAVRSFASDFADRHDELSVLVNNAGGIFGSRRTTTDSFEMTIGTNHLGPFLLTELLTPLLVKSAPSRIINVASAAHTFVDDGIRLDDLQWTERKYSQKVAYGESKLANILHVRELNRRLSEHDVTAYAVHPGVVKTQFGSGGDSWIVGLGVKLFGWRFRSPAEGAETSVWAATDPEIVDHAGGYFADCAPSKSTRHAKDDEAARALWDLSAKLVAE